MATIQIDSVPSTALGRDAAPSRVVGLDSIRFVCASIVLIGHLNLLPHRLYGASAVGLTKVAIGIWNTLFNGPAAVIIFFLISGFCIHFPYRKNRELKVRNFYVRRAIRILGPAIPYALLESFVINSSGDFLSFWNNSVLWSVVCECIYYLLYPLILIVRRRFGWWFLLSLASAATILLIIIERHNLPLGDNAYVALGGWTWLVGLPVWLMGCLLAEVYTSFPTLTPMKMISFRALLVIISVAVSLYHFHATGIAASFCVLLDLFAIPAYFWLGCEIVYMAQHGFNMTLERGGAWSYSLYLCHPLTPHVLALLGLGWMAGMWPTHLVMLLFAFGLSYLYYLAIERPTHKLAIAASQVFNQPRRS